MRSAFLLQNPWRSQQEYRFSFYKRDIFHELVQSMGNEKILGLIGSRQVGKSSLLFLLIEHLLKSGVEKDDIFYFNLDSRALHDVFESPSSLLQFVGSGAQKKYVFIDEVQRLPSPGLFLKELHDLRLNIKVVYSGSSQIEINSKLTEHLVGRVRQFEIQRLSFDEYCFFRKPIVRKKALEEYMLFGSYPEVALADTNEEKKRLLRDIFQSYVQKDIVELLNIERVELFRRLLIVLAGQIGGILNTESLCRSLRCKRDEIERYLSVLEQTFIIRRVYPFFQNYKKEVVKAPKIYFLDLGLRNFLLRQFLPLELRNDEGELFENFYFLQLLSGDPYGFDSIHYWRTTNQTEVDFIIRSDEGVSAVETKWNGGGKTPRSFQTLKKYYPDMDMRVVRSEDFTELI